MPESDEIEKRLDGLLRNNSLDEVIAHYGNRVASMTAWTCALIEPEAAMWRAALERKRKEAPTT